MNFVPRGVALLLFISLPLIGFSQKGFGISPTPSWVKLESYSTEVPDSADVSGYYYLLYNYQYNTETNQAFFHYAIKVVNDKGLSDASSIDRSYDPSYQRLEFHSLYVQRGNQKIDHLKKSNFEVIQREENLSRASYDGSLTAISTLKDVKAGDIVVYTLSLSGVNPVFKGHQFKKFYMEFGVAAGKISYRLVTNVSKKFYFKDFGKVPERKETTENSQKVYSWESLNVPAVKFEDRVPYWYDEQSRVQLTDFENWEEFSRWNLELFNVNKTRSPQLKRFIDSLKTVPDEEQRILGAIRIVQEKVRYFSFVDGMSSYRPHNPSDVFDNRYGDCKDKALLLSEILNELGVESYPLLVSTDYGRVMNEMLPSPSNFNHSITQFKYKDSLHYIDATMTSQRGSLKKIVTPNYYYGVVADKDQPGLTKIAENTNWSVIRAREDYEFKEIGGPATLKVETTYTGEEADGVRDAFKSKTRSETDQSYLDFYANDIHGVTLAKSVRFIDDTISNSIVVYEEYNIPDYWEYDSVNGNYKAEHFGRVISSYLVNPSTRVRKTPFSIRYPLDVELITNVHCSETWNVDDYKKTITAPGFEFKSSWRYSDQVIELRYSLHNKVPFIDGSKTTEYLKKIDDVYGELSFQISHPGDGNAVVASTSEVSDSDKDFRVVILILVVGVGLYFAGRRLYEIDPRSRQLTERYDQIGGWLILPAIGITLSPFRILYDVFTQWENHRTIFSGTFSIHSFVLTTSLVANLVLLASMSLAAISLWKRRTSAIHFISAGYVLSLIFTVADISAAKEMYDVEITSDDTRRIVMSLVSIAVWLPYIWISERSRGTFTQRLKRDES